MLNVLVALLNADPTHFSSRTGTLFPKHMNTSVCQHLVTGGGYFDFRGRDGLLREVQKIVPKTHWLYVELKKPSHRPTLNKLVGLRNYAAHGSEQSKQAVKEAITGPGPRDHRRLEIRLQPPPPALIAGLPTASPLHCHLYPPMNDSRSPWTSSRGPVTSKLDSEKPK